MDEIFKRQSIRKFKKDEVYYDTIEKLLNAAMQAPSARNSQPWEFIVVSDKEDIEAVSQMSPYAEPAKNANKLIITLANLDELNKKGTKDWFQQDLSACNENILLQAVSEGLGAVWMGFYPNIERSNKLKTYFECPDNIIPFSVIAIGYPDEKKEVLDYFKKDRIHFDKY